MSTETFLWDGSENLDNPESIAFHISDAMDDCDPALMASLLGDIAKSVGMNVISRRTGVDRATLYKALVSEGRHEIDALKQALGVIKDGLGKDPSVFNEAAE